MKKFLLASLVLVAFPLLSLAGSKVTYHATVTRNASNGSDTPTVLRASVNALCEAFNRSSEDSFEKGLSSGTIKFIARQGTTSAYYSQSTYGTYGQWFTARSFACVATNSNRRVACQYKEGYFYIIHLAEKAVEGDSYTFTQLFVQAADTVEYIFNVTLGSADQATSDQPEYQEVIEHRADILDKWPVKPLMKQNDGAYLSRNYLQVSPGDNVTFYADYDTTLYKALTLKIANRLGKSLRT